MDIFVCPICEVEITKYHFARHLKTVHQINDIESFYIKTKLNGVIPVCKCGCGKKIRFSNWKDGYPCNYIRGHNAVDDTSFKNKEMIKKNVEKRKKGYADGKYSAWNKGLTKESDKRVSNLSQKASQTTKQKYQTGELIPWQKGLTKETDERLRKSSETRKRKYKEGATVIWNKGLTKESDERIANIAQAISKSFNHEQNKLQLNEFQDKVNKHNSKFELLTSYENYDNKYTRLKFKCLTCGSIQEKTLSMLESTPICFNCHPKDSKGQLEIYEFVK